jgi:hypothetical protein
MDDIAPLKASITVGLSVQAAFDRFTADFGAWWPAEFTWSQPALLQGIGMDCRLGGLMSETGPHGFRIDWGRIVAWEPPSSLSFLWQISAERVPVPDPDQASTVSVAFTPADDSTSVEVTHRSWDRHGPAARDYRNQFQQAWPMALDRFQRYVEG